MTIHEFKFPDSVIWRWGGEEPKPTEESMEKKIIRLEAEVNGAENKTQT